MANHRTYKYSYELSEHNITQVIFFVFIFALTTFVVFYLLLPMLKYFFENFLNGIVYNNTGDFMPYSTETPLPRKGISYFFSWAVDIYKNTSQESRYWFNPLMSLMVMSILIGFTISIIISSLMSASTGFMRQKIDRVIYTNIERIAQFKKSLSESDASGSVIDEIVNSDLKAMTALSNDWLMTLEDIKTLKNAIIWKSSSFMYRLFHVNDGIKLYMRFYFTAHYSNAVLGFVYIGAAILIIIIGLRGLKFIPPTQPSLVLFALGLEFSLLLVYAVTLIYSKLDEDGNSEIISQNNSAENIVLNRDFGSSREIENLLRVFLIKDKSKKN